MNRNLEILEGMEPVGQSLLKDFITDVFGDKDVKTEAIITGVRVVTGSDPVVDRRNPNYNVIRFSKKHQSQFEALFNKKVKQYRDATGQVRQSNVKVDAKSLVMPMIIKKIMPYAIGVFVAGVLVGRVTKRVRRK